MDFAAVSCALLLLARARVRPPAAREFNGVKGTIDINGIF